MQTLAPPMMFRMVEEPGRSVQVMHVAVVDQAVDHVLGTTPLWL